MQTEQQRDAEAKFWATPELVENLFSTLDLDSTLSLARVMNRERVYNLIYELNLICPSVLLAVLPQV